MNGVRQKKENDTPGVMSFEEIGRALGITGSGAWMLYKSALRKLRGHPQIHGLLELALSRDELRNCDLRSSLGSRFAGPE